MAADLLAADTRARLVVAAAEGLDAPVQDVALVSVEPRMWPDPALGCPEPGFLYAQVLTPGYVVVARSAAGVERTLHTDEDGRTVVCPSG
jgi:hypothetical protein